MRAKTSARTIDEYLATLSPERRAALQALREAIRSAAPEAEECISYQLPAFRQEGPLAFFGATGSHCSLHMEPTTLEAHKDELEGYDTSKGTIRFQPDDPLPAPLVRKLVKTRLAEIGSSRGGYGKSTGRSPSR